MILGDSENNDFISDVLDLNKECFSNIRYSRNIQNVSLNNNCHEEVNPVNNQLIITSNLPTNHQINPLNSQINQNINLQINQNLNHQLNPPINQQINQENNQNLNIFQFVDQFNNFNSPNQLNQNISTITPTKLICSSPNTQENIILPIKVENAIDLSNTNIPNSIMNCCDKFEDSKKYSTDQLNLPTNFNDLVLDTDFKQINQIELNRDSDLFKNWNQTNQSKTNLSPIDMEDQERIKLERKRMRNRIAASKCRRKKMEKINKLEEYNNCLKNEIDLLRKTINKLHKQNATLKDQLVLHVNSGCELSSVGFNPYDQTMVN